MTTEKKIKTVEEARNEMHSSENQKICGKLVEREILACVSGLVEDLIRYSYDCATGSNNSLTLEDFENMDRYNVEIRKPDGTYVWFEGTDAERQEEIEAITDRIDELTARQIVLQEKIDEIENDIDNLEFDNPGSAELQTARRRLAAYGKALKAAEQYEYRLDIDRAELEAADPEPVEIFEYWLVTPWIAEKLSSYGEPIADNYPPIWGRTTTGQAIKLDYVIGCIAADLEILDGQRYAWNAPKEPQRIEINLQNGIPEVHNAPETVEIYISDYDAEDPETGEKPNQYKIFPTTD